MRLAHRTTHEPVLEAPKLSCMDLTTSGWINSRILTPSIQCYFPLAIGETPHHPMSQPFPQGAPD